MEFYDMTPPHQLMYCSGQESTVLGLCYEYELLSARLSFATRHCFRYRGLRRKQEATTNVTIGAPFDYQRRGLVRNVVVWTQCPWQFCIGCTTKCPNDFAECSEGTI